MFGPLNEILVNANISKPVWDSIIWEDVPVSEYRIIFTEEVVPEFGRLEVWIVAIYSTVTLLWANLGLH